MHCALYILCYCVTVCRDIAFVSMHTIHTMHIRTYVSTNTLYIRTFVCMSYIRTIYVCIMQFLCFLLLSCHCSLHFAYKCRYCLVFYFCHCSGHTGGTGDGDGVCVLPQDGGCSCGCWSGARHSAEGADWVSCAHEHSSAMVSASACRKYI